RTCLLTTLLDLLMMRTSFDIIECSSEFRLGAAGSEQTRRRRSAATPEKGDSMDDNTRPQKLLAEVLGTALLVFIGVGSVPATLIVNGDAPFTMADLGVISFAFGMVVVATVYALGHVSGNHINPAVTLALASTGKFPWKDVPAYIGAQLVGATLGAFAIVGVLGARAHEVGLGVAQFNESLGVGYVQGFFAEFVGTFILVFVIFGVIH